MNQETCGASDLRNNFQVLPVPPTTAIQEVRIFKAENGFIVIFGCKQFVSQSFTEVASGLELYFKNPEEARKKYCSKN